MTAVACGTPAGYTRHQYHNEEPCDDCREAKAAYDRSRMTPDRLDVRRKRARAQQRACRRLARLHPAEYSEFYAEEKAAEGIA